MKPVPWNELPFDDALLLAQRAKLAARVTKETKPMAKKRKRKRRSKKKRTSLVVFLIGGRKKRK